MSVSHSAMPLLIFKINTDKKKQPPNRQNYTLLKTIQCDGAYKTKGWILVSLFVQMLDATIEDGVNFKTKNRL